MLLEWRADREGLQRGRVRQRDQKASNDRVSARGPR